LSDYLKRVLKLVSLGYLLAAEQNREEENFCQRSFKPLAAPAFSHSLAN